MSKVPYCVLYGLLILKLPVSGSTLSGRVSCSTPNHSGFLGHCFKLLSLFLFFYISWSLWYHLRQPPVCPLRLQHFLVSDDVHSSLDEWNGGRGCGYRAVHHHSCLSFNQLSGLNIPTAIFVLYICHRKGGGRNWYTCQYQWNQRKGRYRFFFLWFQFVFSVAN